MKVTDEQLPHSRVKYTVSIDEAETAEFFTQALKKLASKVNVAGFRPGKAPVDVVRGQVKAEELREEAYSHAARHAWSKIAEESKYLPIEDPQVEIGSFEEGKPAELTFSFDIRPEVKVGDWQKIKVKDFDVPGVDDKEAEDVINSLARAHAKTVVKPEVAGEGDKVELTFTGSLNGKPLDKLAAKRFGLVIGQGGVVPGFEDRVKGMKRGDNKSFSLDFPKDHFDKELAGKSVNFDVTIDEVFRLVLPARDKEFAKKFGHDTFDQLFKAVKEDLVRHKREDAALQKKAKWLAEFDKTVKTDVPRSLLQTEVERSRQNWTQFLMEKNIAAQDWLERRGTTMEKMEEDWRKAAEASVRVGLGLAEVAKQQGKELKSDEDYQDLLDNLVNQAK